MNGIKGERAKINNCIVIGLWNNVAMANYPKAESAVNHEIVRKNWKCVLKLKSVTYVHLIRDPHVQLFKKMDEWNLRTRD